MQWNRSAGEAQAKLKAELEAVRAELAQVTQERGRLALDAAEARDAAKAAHEAREDVRRVLAAARANEQRAEQEVQHAREECRLLVDRVAEAERARGEIEGQLQDLGELAGAERLAVRAQLEEAQARAWALSAEHGATMQALHREQAQSEADLRAMAAQLPAQRRAVAARGAALVALICLALAGLLLPGILGLAAGDERARLLDGFTGLGARTPVYVFSALATLGLGLMGWTMVLLREGRGSQRLQSGHLARLAGELPTAAKSPSAPK